MPRIKAYSGAGQLIPVDEAKVKTAFQCPCTQRVFAHQRDYVKHLAHLRKTRIHAAIARKHRDMLLEELRHQTSFADIIRWIELHPDFIWRNANPRDPMPEGFGVTITYLKISHYLKISNSHSAPRGGVTNWGPRKADKTGNPLPTGYPGWNGYIEYKITGEKSPVHYWASGLLTDLGINTGTGGGMSEQRYGYEVTFWDDDWPGIKLYRALTEPNLTGVVIGNPVYFKSR
jgi:uncharacterized C2H2 Zn-finger protein